jgi:hypothetical protein
MILFIGIRHYIFHWDKVITEFLEHNIVMNLKQASNIAQQHNFYDFLGFCMSCCRFSL